MMMRKDILRKGLVLGILVLFVIASIVSALNTDSLSTTEGGNNPPYPPCKPSPPDQAEDVDINADLSWIGGDPDVGDTVTYDVFFGSMVPLQQVASNISAPSYNPGILSHSLSYYWRVVAWDNHGLSTDGPGWRFTIANFTNNPPERPTIEGRVDGVPNTWYEFRFSSTDPDGDTVTIFVDWGDGHTNSTQGGSGDIRFLYHCWYESGDYTIKAKAIDEHGAESEWATSLIHMPTSRSIHKPSISFFEHHAQLVQFLIKIVEV